MKKIIFAIFSIVSSISLAQTINQNQQNVNINFDNLPVIEKPVYITKYRTVYVDRPQPKRIAKRLEKPVLLLGYLWVYPYDLGEFTRNPAGVINNINAQIPYGRNTWRVPDPDELAVMEANANQVGLGDDIYMDTSHRNGIVRLVSTGPTHSEMVAQEQAKRLKEEQERKEAYDREYRETHDDGININGKIWATRNCDTKYYYNSGTRMIFADKPSSAGGWFEIPDSKYNKSTQHLPSLPKGWRLPTRKEFEELFSNVLGHYDLENSCWMYSTNLILPAAGFKLDTSGIGGYVSHQGENWGNYLCSDGEFLFDVDKKSCHSNEWHHIHESGVHWYYKVRLIKESTIKNKYFE